MNIMLCRRTEPTTASAHMISDPFNESTFRLMQKTDMAVVEDVKDWLSACAVAPTLEYINLFDGAA